MKSDYLCSSSLNNKEVSVVVCSESDCSDSKLVSVDCFSPGKKC